VRSVLHTLALVKDELNEAVEVLEGAWMDHIPMFLSTLWPRTMCSHLDGCGVRSRSALDTILTTKTYAKKKHQDMLAALFMMCPIILQLYATDLLPATCAGDGEMAASGEHIWKLQQGANCRRS